MKRMLINATQEEELRMAMVDGQRLYDLNIEAPASERKKANIYKGKITRIEPSLEAAFVDYGAERHGFLPLKEISSEYFVKEAKGGGKPNIKEVLREGQDIVVQVDKEERGNKGAALTTFVSLAGRFIVLKPNKARSGGVSRRITGQDRDAARKSLDEIVVPDGMSVILRTAGIDRSAEELAWDLENLLTVWTAILNVVLERPSPFLIYRESDSVVRALRDYLTNEIGEILIDDEATFKDAYEHVEQTMPHNLKKLKHYVDPVPLFTRFQIESQIESAFAHNVNLPSGGSIVIDHTEALVSIDINSARATKGGDIEATALNTNLEAADEIARQLRIRDLGGLIVIDFIDMGPSKHQRDVENRLRDAVRQDRARVQIGKISRFGLLEMSRQRLRPSIGESAHMTCPRCSGFGNIRSVESLALAILRIVGEEARKERTAKVIAQLPVEVSTYLLNEKRDWVQNLEDRNDTQVVLVANPLLETPHYEVRRVRDDQTELPENTGVSYSLADASAEPEAPQAILERKSIETPVVGTLKPSKPAPKREKQKDESSKKKKGLFASIVSLFSGGDEEGEKTQSRRKKSSQQSRTRRSQPSKRRGESQRKKTQKKAPQQTQAKKTSKKTSTRRKPAQKDGPQNQQQGQQAQDQGEGSKNEPKRSPRSRRSRSGRRRRRGGADKPEQVAESQQQSTDVTGKDAPKPEAKKEKTPKSEGKPAGKTRPKQQSASNADAGPPRARTDAERAADAAKTSDTTSPKATVTDTTKQRKAEDEPKRTRKPSADKQQQGKPDDAPATEKKAEPKTKPKLLPWEPQSLPVAAKPASKPEPSPEQKPQSKPESKTAPEQAKKPESRPKQKTEPKPDPKPEPNPETRPQSKTEPKPQTKPEPKPEAPAPAPAATESKPVDPSQS